MAKVNFIRKHTKAEVNDEPIVDGNFIVTGEGNVFIDYGTERIEIISSGGSITGDTLPIGSITAYGKETAPANWLICDGSAVSRTSYADLFAVIGTKYGEGDGSTTFNLPNLKGRVPVGLDSDDTDFNTIGKTGGEKKHKLTIEELTEHAHDIHGNTNTYSASGVNYYQTSSIFAGYAGGEQKKLFYNAFGAEKTGGDQPHNNLQPYEVNNFIIKAFQSAGVVAEVVNAQTESDTDVYGCNYINNLNTYSTEEKRVGTWIDGKPLYSKTISFETSDNMNIFLDIQLSNIDTIFIDESASFIINNIETLGVNWYYAETDWIRTWYHKGQNNLRSKSPSSLGVRTAYVTLKYTKTTD